ncbi:hypothetical protein G6F35_015211 [Rhizopus arrhizus]|nr:hypothetical protein G6F35_015211 [Rhizopus arrhizus]
MAVQRLVDELQLRHGSGPLPTAARDRYLQQLGAAADGDAGEAGHADGRGPVGAGDQPDGRGAGASRRQGPDRTREPFPRGVLPGQRGHAQARHRWQGDRGQPGHGGYSRLSS